jgi:hypothetical protein
MYALAERPLIGATGPRPSSLAGVRREARRCGSAGMDSRCIPSPPPTRTRTGGPRRRCTSTTWRSVADAAAPSRALARGHRGRPVDGRRGTRAAYRIEWPPTAPGELRGLLCTPSASAATVGDALASGSWRRRGPRPSRHALAAGSGAVTMRVGDSLCGGEFSCSGGTAPGPAPWQCTLDKPGDAAQIGAGRPPLLHRRLRGGDRAHERSSPRAGDPRRRRSDPGAARRASGRRWPKR